MLYPLSYEGLGHPTCGNASTETRHGGRLLPICCHRYTSPSAASITAAACSPSDGDTCA